MSDLEKVLRETMERIANKAVKSHLAPIEKELKNLRRTLEKLAPRLARSQSQPAPRHTTVLDLGEHVHVSEEASANARLTPLLIAKLRKRLGISQAQLSRLVGVSVAAVNAWESGRAKPRGANRTALVALRGMGRRDVSKLLAGRPEEITNKSPGETDAS